MVTDMNILLILSKIFNSNFSEEKIDEGGITMLKAYNLAKYIITKCTLDNKAISNLQLQKILYFIQGAFYFRFKHKAFDDTIEAWDYGPVIPDVYYSYNCYGSEPICKIYSNFTSLDSLICNEETDAEDEINVINLLIEKLREKNPWDLVKTSHEDNTPWSIIYKGYWREINDELIKDYFIDDKYNVFNKLGINFDDKPKQSDFSEETIKSLDILKKIDDIIKDSNSNETE